MGQIVRALGDRRRVSRAARLTVAMIALAVTMPPVASTGTAGAAVTPPVPHVNVTLSDLEFILDQIKIAEAHATRTRTDTGVGYTGSCLTANDFPAGRIATTYPYQLTAPWGLRQVDGRCNNLVAGQSEWGASDTLFPRLTAPAYLPDPAYTSTDVVDAAPRVTSNLIADQTEENPAATVAAGPSTADASGNLEILNVTPDFGTSAPYSSWFTFFGQFFDHGLDLIPKGGAGTVTVPLQKNDDPLYSDSQNAPNAMFLTRGSRAGTGYPNRTTPYVDQNQTYTSHPSHQVFLREYELRSGKPFATGALLDGVDGGLPTWGDVKRQARDMLGITLTDADVVDLPLVATDQYGKFTPAASGFAQLVKTDGSRVSGTPASPVAISANIARSGHAFLDDIAHRAAPFAANGTALPPDADNEVTSGSLDCGGAPKCYDNELLDAHYVTGDGRGNENIGLTAVHHIFHSEHNTVLADIMALLSDPSTSAAVLAEWKPNGVPNGERLFLAARFVTEMEYQHLVFAEFARRLQPLANAFATYSTSVMPDISLEFSQAVYRFGHSMLNESIKRTNPAGDRDDIGLIQGFLNPTAFRRWSGTTLSPADAAGVVAKGMTDQRGNEIDEFVTGALRNNLLGVPLDLATLNLARGRDVGLPSLNGLRRSLYAATGQAQLAPYGSWAEFELQLRHPASLVNFVAAYGTHPSITQAITNGHPTTLADKRAAAKLLVEGTADAPADWYEFLNSLGPGYAPVNGLPTTGIESVDAWIGGLAEGPTLGFGAGLLGSTFDYVFTQQALALQNGDRLYYLSRLAGLNLLAEIDANSMAALIQRNTSAQHVPNPAFSIADCLVELGKLPNLPAQCGNLTLSTAPDGTVIYKGLNNLVFGGTPNADRVQAGKADDTVWGDDGDDTAEGGYGNDSLNGGAGADLLKDMAGDDLINGNDGDDLLFPGPGLDVVNGGPGKDLVFGGTNPKEVFGGAGDDFVYGGDDGDTITAGDGTDWVEGASGGDSIAGDNRSALNLVVGGNDVLIGGLLDDLYLAEGGDDLILDGPGFDSMVGGLGWDWACWRDDNVPAAFDLATGIFAVLPPGVNADRFFQVEGLCGGPLDDILSGDAETAATLTPAGNDLKNPAVISGLNVLLRNAPTFNGGNILLGGPGSDQLTGRGGNDLLDGDAYIVTRLAYTLSDGTKGSASSLAELLNQLTGRTLKVSDIAIVREVKKADYKATDIDTAFFSDVRANYTVTQLTSSDPTVVEYTVSHLSGLGIDGVDRVRNVERLQFGDGTVVTLARPQLPGGGVDVFTPSAPVVGRPVSVSAASDPNGFSTVVTYTWQYQKADGSWATTGAPSSLTYTPTLTYKDKPLRVVATYKDGLAVAETVTSPATPPVGAANAAPTGSPVVTPTRVLVGVPLTVTTTTIADADGLGAFSYRWQRGPIGGPWTDIPGETGTTYVPTEAGVTIRVVVSYTDGKGYAEKLTSVPSTLVGWNWVGTIGIDIWTGSSGGDNADGLPGVDTLSGAGGDDWITGGAGDDALTGGIGNDNFVCIAGANGIDRVTDFDANPTGGQDKIDVRALKVTRTNFSSVVSIVLLNGVVQVRVSTTSGTARFTLANITSTTVIDITDFITL